MKSAVFGMISTKASEAYTPHAIESFFRTVQLSSSDKFFLIDNDASFVPGQEMSGRPITIIRQQSPRTFAENANEILRRAMAEEADAFLLNNDVIFTENWLQPLLIEDDAILSPLSNREVQYEVGDFKWKNSLDLSDYLGREAVLAELVAQHRLKSQGTQQVISLPFFCVKIPYRVYSVVGFFDESFGRGGAEDNDYCIRACLSGFAIRYALTSFVLHFSGKSTWSGAETEEETKQRCDLFRQAFCQKWGLDLTAMYIDGNTEILKSRPRLVVEAAKGNMRAVIEGLRIESRS